MSRTIRVANRRPPEQLSLTFSPGKVSCRMFGTLPPDAVPAECPRCHWREQLPSNAALFVQAWEFECPMCHLTYWLKDRQWQPKAAGDVDEPL